ncbi:MAG: dTMP kinase [Candidatus Aminicenantia bacterium]
MLKRGILIAIEGIDGAGKSTQAVILRERLKKRGFPVALLKEPSQSRWGRKIKEISKKMSSINPNEELELFIKDRKSNVKRNILPALRDKKIVIVDRYYISTIAYQGARGIDKELIRKENEKFAPVPDIVFILDIDPSESLSRIKREKERLFEEKNFLKDVRENFLNIKIRNTFFIDARARVEEIAERMERVVLEYIERESIVLNQ